MQAIQAQLASVGISAKADHGTQLARVGGRRGKRGERRSPRQQYVAVDPSALSVWFCLAVYWNWSHYASPQLLSLLNQAAWRSRRAAGRLYDQAQTIINQQALMMPLHETRT